MWNMMIIEFDHYIDPKTGYQKREEIERYDIPNLKSLANFLLNVKKDVNSNPEFFCQACGFWTSYQLILIDYNEKIVGVKNLFELFLENEELNWNFENISEKQLQELLASNLT